MTVSTMRIKERFVRLVVTGATDRDQSGVLRYACRCDCGNVVYVRATSLRSGSTQSCGCLRRERAAENFAKSPLRGMVHIHRKGTTA